MTLATPYLIIDTTSTAGVGTYTLTGATSGGYRSLANAVTAGHATAGQTCYYTVRDTTTSGGTLAFEGGIGTIGAGGTTLARTTISESSNSDAAVNWGSGGSRQVLIAIGVEGLALLAAANPFTGNNTFAGTSGFSGVATFTANPVVERTSALASLALRRLTSTAVGVGEVLYQGQNTTPSLITYASSTGVILSGTAGAEASELRWAVRIAGALTTALKLKNDGILENAITSAKYDAFPGGGVTKLLFGSTIPTGWTRSNETNPSIIRLATVSDTIGATGGTQDIFTSWTTGGYTLLLADIPSHDHNAKAFTYGVTAGTDNNLILQYAAGTPFATITNAAGGGGSHSHPMTTPRYRIAAWATKD